MAADETELAVAAHRPAQPVVVVEDDADAREDIAELLEYEGFQVIACADAEQALLGLASAPAAVLVTDIGLPGMTGIALGHEAAKRFPGIQIILMSGFRRSPAMDCRPEWVYFQKPINVDDLIAAIRRS